eukprot:PLAT7714.1.p1 GENE.PLAT7714.1~~PLAT7714.1.p1  ORF type:complete len:449 (+),score=141.59 PLAT7714.1:37-1383(+)
MSSFGRFFRITTFGESHGAAVGVTIDGVPPCLPLTPQVIQPQLQRRRPGQSKLTTSRKEADKVHILSGVEHGRTLGSPVTLLVWNKDVKPKDYAPFAGIPRPGHAEFTYQVKYGIRAASGGGRSSARETVARVAAGAVAESWLAAQYGVRIVAWVDAVGCVALPADVAPAGHRCTREHVDRLGRLALLHGADGSELRFRDCDGQLRFADGTLVTGEGEESKGDEGDEGDEAEVVTVRCPHSETACRMAAAILQAKQEKDSIGGVIRCQITGVPAGWGEPAFDKLEAMLAHAMLSLPATKGFEIGSGFAGARMRGSQHNDAFVLSPTAGLTPATNNAGGTLGGISTGAPISFRVAIKPVSTIGKPQSTAGWDGKPATLRAAGRHDPCVLPRAVPLVEAMAALVLADAALQQEGRLAASKSGKRRFGGAEGGDDGDDDSPPTKRARIEAE